MLARFVFSLCALNDLQFENGFPEVIASLGYVMYFFKFCSHRPRRLLKTVHLLTYIRTI